MTTDVSRSTAAKRPVGRPRANGKPHLTKAQIFQVAASLITQYGYGGTSLRMIASQLDASPASILNAFSNKEALLNALIEYAAGAAFTFYQQLRAKQLAPDVALYKSLYEEAYAVADNPDFAALFYLPELNRPQFSNAQQVRENMLRHYEGLLRKGQKAGIFLRLPITHTAEQLFQLTETSILSLPTKQAPHPKTQAQAAADFCLRAILVKPEELPNVKQAAAQIELSFVPPAQALSRT